MTKFYILLVSALIAFSATAAQAEEAAAPAVSDEVKAKCAEAGAEDSDAYKACVAEAGKAEEKAAH